MLEEINVAGLSLKTFGLCFALSFIACYALAEKRLRELGKPPEWATEMILAALVGGLVGARLYWVVQNWDEAGDDLLGSIFSGSGLVFYGGAIGGAVFVCAWAWRRGFLGLQLLDLAAPALAIGYAIGRIGCQISGDGDYGEPSDLPWAMPYPDGAVPTTEDVHPTPIYEALAMGLATWLLWQLRDRLRPGALFALWMVIAGLERFLIEFIRRNDPAVAGLTVAQLESVALLLAGVVFLAVLRRRHGSIWLPGGAGAAARRPATA